MKVHFSKEFQKQYRKLSGKFQKSVNSMIIDVKNAKTFADINNCKRIEPYRNIYRIRIGGLRAFFLFHIFFENDKICFLSIVPRGQAYDKKIIDNLKKKDV